MPRPRQADRRPAVLAAATDHVISHGLSGLNLRALAAALDTSPRMLLYDFGSKEALLTAVLEEARRRQVTSLQAALDAELTKPGAAADPSPILHGDRVALRVTWRWFAEHPHYVQLLFEVYLDCVQRPGSYQGRRELVDDWIRYITTAFGVDDAAATLVLAVLRGLALDRLTAPSGELTDQALERFVDLLG